MKTKTIYYTPEFLKYWEKIPQNIKNKAIDKEKIFRDNQFHPSLKTHKLKGVLTNFYSFSVDLHYRIVFHFQDQSIFFDAIGTHAVYK